MLLQQLPTSSPSSSSDSENRDRMTSALAHTENPRPSSQPPPRTRAANPEPEVDEEAQRRLTRILRSMPSDFDTATVYATLKARLGIVLSKDKVTTSTTQSHTRNPSSIHQAQTLLRTTESTPVTPLVQYSEDDSEEDEAQPASVPPPNGGSANSPTLLGPTQPAKVGDIDDDSTEDLLPPSEILQQGMIDWTFIPNAEDDSVSD